MNAAGEVQRLLLSVRSRLRNRPGPCRTRLSQQHYVEAFEEMASAFDSMAAVRLPLCLVFDAAVDLALGLLKLGLADLAICVLHLKAPDARDILRNASTNPLFTNSTPVDNSTPCPICSRQQKAAEAERSSSFSGSLEKINGSSSGRLENLHLLHSAGTFVLLNACATAAHWLHEREDRSGCEEADRRASVLERIESLQLLLCAWKAAKEVVAPAALPLQLERLLFPAVLLVSRLSESLGSSGYSSTAAQLLSRCLYTVEAFESRFSPPYWTFWWQLATLLYSRRQYAEASRICAAVAAAITQALQQPLAARRKREFEYKQLLFAAILIKCKLREQTITPVDALDELQNAVKMFTSSVWADQDASTLPQTRAGRAAAAAVRPNNGDVGTAKCNSLEQQIRKLAFASHAFESSSASAAPNLFLDGGQSAAYRSLLLSLGLVLLQPEGQWNRGSPVWGLGSSNYWDACSRTSNAQIDGTLHAGDAEFSGSRSPASRRRDEAKGSRKKKLTAASATSGAGAAADSNNISTFSEALLLKLLDVADPILGDFLAAATKLDMVFKTECRGGSSDPKTAASAATAATAGSHDSGGHMRKKPSRQSAAVGQSVPAATAAAGGSGVCDESLRELVRAAQRAAASLPLCVHLELLWRLAEGEDILPPGKLLRCWRALEYRLIYMNFFQPPVTELEVFELEGELAGDGLMSTQPLELQQQQLQKLEELLRQGWGLASCCDLQGLRPLEEITVISGVRTDEQRLQTRGSQQQRISTLEAQMAAAASAEAEKDTDGELKNQATNNVKQKQLIRLLLARRWDWEADLRSSAASAASVAAATAAAAGAASAAALANSDGAHTQEHGEGLVQNVGAYTGCTAADLSSSLPLICGMQLIAAKSYEDAAAKYKAEIRRMEAPSPWEAVTAAPAPETTAPANVLEDAYESGNSAESLQCEQVLQAVYGITCDGERPPLPLRLLLRQHQQQQQQQQQQHKLLQPVSNALAVFHEVLAPSEGAEFGGTAKDADAGAACLKIPHLQRQAKGSEAATAEPTTVHVLQLRQSSAGPAGNHEFLVYTKVAAGCAISPVDSGFAQDDKSTTREGSPSRGPLTDETFPEPMQWRLQGNPRSVLQSCLGVHLTVLCAPVESLPWLSPPFPHFNVLFNLPNRKPPTDALGVSLGVWAETEGEFPLNVLIHKLCTWLLLRQLEAALDGRGEPSVPPKAPFVSAAALRDTTNSNNNNSSSSSTLVRNPSLHGEGEVNAELRLNLALEVTALWTEAYTTGGLEELLKTSCSEYLSEVLLTMWHGHILPLANILLAAGASGDRDGSLAYPRAADAQLSAAADGFGLLLLLYKAAQQMAFLMTKCRFNFMRPLAAAAVLLFHLTQRYPHLSSGEASRVAELLRGLIERAEASACELAAPLVEAVGAAAAAPAAPAAEAAAAAAAASALLASADPAVYWEQQGTGEAVDQEDTLERDSIQVVQDGIKTSNGKQLQDELLVHHQQEQQLKVHTRASPTWDAEPAEAWTLLCQMYELEARLTAKPLHDPPSATSSARLRAAPGEEEKGSSNTRSNRGTTVASTKAEGAAASAGLQECGAGEGSTHQVVQIQRLKQQCGLNCYRRCLYLCALADLLPPETAAASAAAADVEATLAAKLESRWEAATADVATAARAAATATTESAEATESKSLSVSAARSAASSSSNSSGASKRHRQLGAPLMVGRGPQFMLLSLPAAAAAGGVPAEASGRPWHVLYGGPVRTHGGLGVSRHQKAVAGTGLRFEPSSLIRIHQLKDTEAYAVAYEEVRGGRPSDLSDTTLPLSCSTPLPLAMLKARIYTAALRCSLPRIAEAVLSDLWSYIATTEGGLKGKAPKRHKLRENALRRLPPAVLRSIADSVVCSFRVRRPLPCPVVSRLELVLGLQQVYRQSVNFQVAVMGRSTDVAEEQLSLLLNSLSTILSSLSSFPPDLLSPLLRSFAALNTTPFDGARPQTRAAEAALLGFASLAAAQLQIPLISGLVQKRLPRCLTLPASAGVLLNPAEKRLILSSWLSACIAAATSGVLQRSPTAAALLETLPMPAWLCDSRSSDGKQLGTLLLSVLLAAPAELPSALQRLAESEKTLFKSHLEKEENSAAVLHIISSVFCFGLKRRLRETQWRDSADAEDLVAEAQAATESAMPTAAATLRFYTETLAHLYSAAAEPLVEWLNADDLRDQRTPAQLPQPIPAVGNGLATGVAATGKGVSAQDTAAQVQALRQQEVALERRLRTARADVRQMALQQTAELQSLSQLSSLLLAAPLEVISAHRRALASPSLPTDNTSNSNSDSSTTTNDDDNDKSSSRNRSSTNRTNCRKQQHIPYGFFDFDAIAADPLFQPSTDESTAAAAAAAAGSSSETEDAGHENTVHANTVTASSAAVPAAGGAPGGAPGANDCAAVWSAVMLLFQRGATAASCAVAANAPLLAYSTIIHLGNALFFLHLEARFGAALLEELSCTRCVDTASLAESTASPGLEPFVAPTARDGNRVADGAAAAAVAAAANSRQSKRGDLKNISRPLGSVSAAVAAARGYRGQQQQQQQSAEAKPHIPLSVAAGVVAQACSDLLYLLLQQHLLATEKDELSVREIEAILSATGVSPADDSPAPTSTFLQATEEAAADGSSGVTSSESASRQVLICQQAFDVQKINTWYLGAVFIFCIRLLLQRRRWHQAVFLCRRFSRLGRTAPFRCALSLGLWAQQQLLVAKQTAVKRARQYLNAAVREHTAAEEKLAQASTLAAEKEPQEPAPAAAVSKRRTTKGFDAKGDTILPTSSITTAEEAAKAAEEIRKFWEERTNAMVASLAKQQQLAVQLQQELNRQHVAPNPANALLLSLDKARKALWESKSSNGDPSTLGQLLQRVLRQHQKAVHLLRREKQFEGLCGVLCRLGDLAWLGSQQDVACSAWQEAVEACFWRRNMLQEWVYLDDDFFAPDIKQVDIRMRSFLPLYRWARLTHRRSLHQQLHAALLASRILCGVLETAADYPLNSAHKRESSNNDTLAAAAAKQLYAGRSDGGVIRYRMKQLHSHLNFLPASVLSPAAEGSSSSSSAAAELVEALVWFACVLRCCDFTREKAFPLIASAEFVAADICRNVPMAVHCRLVRTLLCIDCGDLQAAYWQLREIGLGVGTAFASLSERGEFPGSVFSGGDFAAVAAATADPTTASGGFNERLTNSSSNVYTSNQQQMPAQGFTNSQTGSAQRNVAAREDLWNWKLDGRLVELYGATNARRFTLAKATWMFAAISNLSAPHLEHEEVARRLEALEQVASSLTALLYELVQDSEADMQTEITGNSRRAASPSQFLQEGSSARHGNRNKTQPERITLHKVLEALNVQLQQPQCPKDFPTQDVYFALMLLSKVQEALGQNDVACTTAEAAALTATTASDLQEVFCLQPAVLNGVRAWQRVARLLLTQKHMTAAAKLTTRLLQLASGRQPAALDRTLKLNVTSEGRGQERVTKGEESPPSISLKSDELSSLPVPPSGAGTAASLLPAAGAICAPPAVVELLVLLADVLVATGQPTKALCLCKWARYYAKEAHLERAAAFSDASLLASQIVAECPALLKVAQTEDVEVIACWRTDPLDDGTASGDSEGDAGVLWGQVASLRRDALLQQQAQAQHSNRNSNRSSNNGTSNSLTSKADTSLRRHCVREGISQTDIAAAADGQQEIAKQKQPSIQYQGLTACELWQSSALPTLYHLNKPEERSGDASPAKGEYLNLYDPKNQRKAVLLLELAEAVQHQPGQTASYFSLVQLAGEQLQRLGEPNPPLCVRVWLHQLHAFRLQLELQLQQHQLLLQRQQQDLLVGPADHPVETTDSNVKAEDQTLRLDVMLTGQLLRYFKTVVQITAFVDTYCGSDLYLHRELFSEALLLSVLMLAASKQLAAQATSGASALGRCDDRGDELLKRVSFRGAQLCMLALCAVENQRQRTAYQMNNAELETTLQSVRCPKPLVRLFASLFHSYNSEKCNNEVSVEENFSCGAALDLLQEMTRRCGSRMGVLSQDRRIVNCLHFVLFSVLNMQAGFGLSPLLAADAFAGSLGFLVKQAETSSSFGANSRKEAQKEVNKGQQQAYDTASGAAVEPAAASAGYSGILLECLRPPQLLQGAGSSGPVAVAAQLLWLPPGAANEESLELLRRALSAAAQSVLGGSQDEGPSAFSRATVTSTTSRGHFSLALNTTKHEFRQTGKGHQQTTSRDQAVLVAIFAGHEVAASSPTAETLSHTLPNLNNNIRNNNSYSNDGGFGVAVCMKTCSRQRIQSLAGACHCAAVEWRRTLKAQQSAGGNSGYITAVKTEDESLESRTLDIFARVFVLFSEGKRLCADAGDVVNALETDLADNSPAGDFTASRADRNTQLQQQQQEQEYSGSKQDGKLPASAASSVTTDRIRLHVAPARHGDLPKGSPVGALPAGPEHSGAFNTPGASGTEHGSKSSGVLLNRHRSRARKSIADFLAETSGIQKTSLEAERSESYSAAARLLTELKKEARAAEENPYSSNINSSSNNAHAKQGKSAGERNLTPAKDNKPQRNNLPQLTEDSLARDSACSVAVALEFFSSLLGASAVAFDCTLEPACRFLSQALSRHQAAVLNEGNSS